MQKKDFCTRLDRLWEGSSMAPDWKSYEQFMVDLYNSHLSLQEKISLGKECLDAVTRRGHFQSYND